MALQNIGIYVLRNLLTGKCYVGQSVNLLARRRAHYSQLRSNTHCNPYLQKAWSKHGEDAFEFAVLELCEIEQLDNREVFWFQKIGEQKLYNLFLGENGKPHRISEETRQKRSVALRGKIFSDEHRAALSEARFTATNYVPKSIRSLSTRERRALRTKLCAQRLELQALRVASPENLN